LDGEWDVYAGGYNDVGREGRGRGGWQGDGHAVLCCSGSRCSQKQGPANPSSPPGQQTASALVAACVRATAALSTPASLAFASDAPQLRLSATRPVTKPTGSRPREGRAGRRRGGDQWLGMCAAVSRRSDRAAAPASDGNLWPERVLGSTRRSDVGVERESSATSWRHPVVRMFQPMQRTSRGCKTCAARRRRGVEGALRSGSPASVPGRCGGEGGRRQRERSRCGVEVQNAERGEAAGCRRPTSASGARGGRVQEEASSSGLRGLRAERSDATSSPRGSSRRGRP